MAARITKITTGVLAGNLFDEEGYDECASAGNYAALVHRMLTEAFPGVNIEVRIQCGRGATPFELKPHAWWEGDDAEGLALEEDILVDVDRIMLRAYNAFDEWVVEAPREA